MAKRGNSEGSVYKRAQDGRYVGAVMEPQAVGPPKRRYVYGRTRAEAVAKMQTAQARLSDGRTALPARDTVATFMARWLTATLPAQVQAGTMRQSTLDSYADLTRRHILPALGAEPIAKLTPAKVRAWLAAKQLEPNAQRRKANPDGTTPPARPLSASTVRYCHAILRAALADATREEITARNVALLVEPPRVRRDAVQPLTTEEARAILLAAATDRLGVLWLVMLSLGLRRGEALALRWDDIDLDARSVTIARSLQRVPGPPDPITGRRRSSLVELAPKTEASAATLALPDAVVAALRSHKSAQAAERLAALAWVDPGLVFTHSAGGALEPRNINRAWHALCDRAGVRRLRVHDLRHSAASFMLGQGVDLKVVQVTLRHSRLATTADIYAHVLDELHRAGADRMDDLLRDIGAG